MNTHIPITPLRTLASVVLLLALPGAASAQSGGPFDLSLSTFNCGGGESAAGAFSLVSAIADPAADQPMTGGIYSISGGFLPAASATACLADFNSNGQVTVQDAFDFLAAYFAGESRADMSGDGIVAIQDIFDYLAFYFAGCP